MKTTFFGLPLDENGTLAVPFLPHRRVTVRTAIWFIVLGLWPVLLIHLFTRTSRPASALEP